MPGWFFSSTKGQPTANDWQVLESEKKSPNLEVRPRSQAIHATYVPCDEPEVGFQLNPMTSFWPCPILFSYTFTGLYILQNIR